MPGQREQLFWRALMAIMLDVLCTKKWPPNWPK
jgi:hypothetical protein